MRQYHYSFQTHAVESSSNTVVDTESATIAGTLDLLLDALVSSLPALFTMGTFVHAPNVPKEDAAIVGRAALQSCWNSVAVIFPQP